MADQTDAALKILVEMGVMGQADVERAREALLQLSKTTSVEAEEIANLGSKTEHTAEQTEKLVINHRALHQIMHMIGHETAPELGRALTGALYGKIGILIALGAAVEFLSKKLQDAAAAAKEMADASAELDTAKWKAQAEALDTVAGAAKEYADEMGRAADNTARLRTEQETSKKIAEEEAKQAAALLKVKEAAALKAAEARQQEEKALREKEHVTDGTPEMEARHKKELDAIKASFEVQAEQQQAEAQIAALRTAQFQEEDTAAQGSTVNRRYADAETRYKAFAGDKQSSDDAAALATFQGRQADLDKKAKEAIAGIFRGPIDEYDAWIARLKAERDKLRQSEEYKDVYSEAYNTARKISITLEASDLVQQQRDIAQANRDKVAALEAAVRAEKQAVEDAKKELDDAKKARQEHTKALNDQRAAIEQMTALMEIQIRGAADQNTASGNPAGAAAMLKILGVIDQMNKGWEAVNKRIDDITQHQIGPIGQ